jgi:Histidine kinase/Histidine kinase-, DNA gyrase B-, and HSP90-like ATPase
MPIGPSQRAPILVGAASFAVFAVLIPVYRLQDVSWFHAITAAFLFVLTCVLLGWAVWHILMKRSETGSVGQRIVGHVLTALAFSAAWTVCFSGFVYLIRPENFMGYLREGPLWQFFWGIVIYGALAFAVRIQKRLKERELAAASAELQALRTQLNPHFLFNTLHSLTQLAREDPVATQDALERFGGLMRYVLSGGRDAAADVPLEDEIAFVRDYLAVERLRLGERLRVEEDIEPDALELAVPPLLLQPLVENAVRHGVAPQRGGGTIRLAAHLIGNQLAIEVADDGNGAAPDAWRRSTGLGLQAVDRQVNARFHGDGEFEIATQPGAGFTARIRIPARIPTKGLS